MATVQPKPPIHRSPLNRRPFKLIGELINNSFARAARAWKSRDLAAYQRLAKLQADLGADYLTFNIDGTQSMMVRPQEMFDFIPDLIPAIQEVDQRSAGLRQSFGRISSPLPRGLRSHEGRPADSQFRRGIAAAFGRNAGACGGARHDGHWHGVGKIRRRRSGQCMSADDVYGAAQRLVELLRDKAGRSCDQIIIDPGLAPVGADTYGLVNMGLDAMRLIRGNRTWRAAHLRRVDEFLVRHSARTSERASRAPI